MLLNIGRSLCVFLVNGDDSTDWALNIIVWRLVVERLLKLSVAGWPVQVFAPLEQRLLDELLHVRRKLGKVHVGQIVYR